MKFRQNFKRNILTLILFAGIVTIVYRKMITSDSLALISDGVGYYVSKLFFIESIKAGEFPFWDPYTVIGTPFLADIQNTVLSPFNILFFFFDSVMAFNLMYIIFMIIAGFFMYLLIYELTEKYCVSIITGFLLAFATMMSGRRMEHTTIVATIAFFPVIIYYLEKYRRSGKELWLILSSVTMAVQFICGFTQIVLYFDMAVFVYLIYVFSDRKIKIKEALIIMTKWIGAYILLMAVQLLPTLRIMLQSGRNEMVWEGFSVLAYDLRILLMMIFPNIYENSFAAFGDYFSSGVDIEIYIGVICLIYIIYEIMYNRKESKVKVVLGIALAAFIYGMIPHIPILGKVVFHIPILNSFRVCGRSLPIFVFFSIMLTGMGMAHIDNSESVRKMKKINLAVLGVIAVVLLFLRCFLSQTILMQGEYNEYFNDSVQGVQVALALCLINVLGLFVCLKVNNEYISKGIAVFLGVIMVVDVMRFSVIIDDTMDSVDSKLDVGVSEQVKELIDQDTSNHYRSFAAMDTTEEFYSQNLKIAKVNRARSTHNKMYNSYLTFLDEKLAYWGIKEIAYYPETINAVKNNIGLISMLGIHYIFDEGDHDLNTKVIDESAQYELEYDTEEVVFQDGGGLLLYAVPADWIQENTTYLVTVVIPSDIPELFYADLYNAQYDDPKQNGYFAKTEDNVLQTIISTEEIPNEEVYFRLIASSEMPIDVSQLKVETIHAENRLEEIIVSDSDIDVYCNPQARQIIYIPEYVAEKNDWGSSWQEDGLYDIATVSYVSDIGIGMDLTGINSEVRNITEKRNSVAATIFSEGDVFVNHAQLSYPGWKAYVDGEEVKLYTVNNLIQGIKVPAGEHQVEFKYEPDDFKIGLVITLFGIALCCAWSIDAVRKYNKDALVRQGMKQSEKS